MDKINIYALIRLASFALNVILILMLYKGCNCERCPQGVISVIRHDTIYRDTSLRVVADIAPNAKKITRNTKKIVFNANKIASDTMPCDTVRIILKEIISELPDTLEYSDTFRIAEDYKITYDAKVLGKLIGIRLSHANLKPEITTTVTNTVVKKPKPQVYIGAVVGVNNTGTNFVFGPAAAVAYHSFMGNYSYDIRSGSHQIGGYWRIFGK